MFVALNPAAEAELEAHHRSARSPLPRRYDAELIDQLRRAGARTIAIDLEFAQQTDPQDDNALVEAIRRAHGKVVLARPECGARRCTALRRDNLDLSEIGARAGEVRLTQDSRRRR